MGRGCVAMEVRTELINDVASNGSRTEHELFVNIHKWWIHSRMLVAPRLERVGAHHFALVRHLGDGEKYANRLSGNAMRMWIDGRWKPAGAPPLSQPNYHHSQTPSHFTQCHYLLDC